MSMRDRERFRNITVRGLVFPSEWDADNKVSRVSIFTFDDDEYEVASCDAGEYLLDHVQSEVMARGHLLPGYRKRKIICIKSFTVFGPQTSQTYEADLSFFPSPDVEHQLTK